VNLAAVPVGCDLFSAPSVLLKVLLLVVFSANNSCRWYPSLTRLSFVLKSSLLTVNFRPKPAFLTDVWTIFPLG